MRRTTEIGVRSSTEAVDTVSGDSMTSTFTGRWRGRSRLVGDHAPAHPEEDQLYVRVQTELVHRPPSVGLHGAAADEQLGGDIRIAVALGRQRQDLALPGGQGLVGVRLAPGPADVCLQRPFRERRAEVAAA